MLPFQTSRDGDVVLLLLHYFGGSANEWTQVCARLESPCQCVCADLPGFGAASRVRGYSVAEMCSQVDELVQSFAPRPVVLGGHSMGGKATMVLAASPPANLREVILVGPSPLVSEPIAEPDRDTMTVANTSRDRAKAFVENGAYRALDEAALAQGIADVIRTHPDAWRAWPQQGTREDWSDRVTDFQVRATIVCGDKDEAIPPPFQREHTLPMVERSGGNLKVIESAGHMLPYEAADELALLFDEVVERVARG